MPKCFYSLLRFWVRVDDVMLRVHETRLFHRFGTHNLVLEYTVREDKVEALKEVRGPPHSPRRRARGG